MWLVGLLSKPQWQLSLHTFWLSAPYVTLVTDFFLTLFQNQKTLLIPGGKLFISFSVSVSCLWHEIEYRIRLYWMAKCDRSVQTEISEQLLHGFRWTFGDSPCFLMVYPHNTDDPLTFSGVPQWGCNDVFLVKYLKYLNVGMTAIKFGTEIHVPLKMDCIDVGWYFHSLARWHTQLRWWTSYLLNTSMMSL